MACMTVTAEQARGLKGTSLGTTEWKEVTQELIDLFAKATGDTQWIHTDPVQAAKRSPFRRKTIAHGYFTLALVPVFFWELLQVTGTRLIINSAANHIEWPAPVPIPSRVRMSATVSDVAPFESGFTIVLQVTIEVEKQAKPGMIGEVHYRYYV